MGQYTEQKSERQHKKNSTTINMQNLIRRYYIKPLIIQTITAKAVDTAFYVFGVNTQILQT